MVTTRPPKTIVKPTPTVALGPVANTDTKLPIYGLFQKRPSFAPFLSCTGRPQERADVALGTVLVPCPSPLAVEADARRRNP